MVPAANVPIMSERVIRLFRHLKNQNLSTISYFKVTNGFGMILLIVMENYQLSLYTGGFWVDK